jgi:hypothetical protein
MPSKALAKNVSSTILALGLIAQATEDTHGEPDHRALASCTRIIHTLMKVFPPFRLDVVNQCLWHGGTRTRPHAEGRWPPLEGTPSAPVQKILRTPASVTDTGAWRKAPLSRKAR